MRARPIVANREKAANRLAEPYRLKFADCTSDYSVDGEGVTQLHMVNTRTRSLIRSVFRLELSDVPSDGYPSKIIRSSACKKPPNATGWRVSLVLKHRARL